MTYRKLPRSFYLRSTIIVAKDLLGKYLVRRLRGKRLVGRIVEVEAYLGEKDPASHAYRGRTKRNEVMFWKGGHLYVYFTYGMHFCSNVVTEDEGKARAVLIRAVEPMEEIALMKKNRGFAADRGDKQSLSNGPAKLCEALGIERAENGTDLLGDEIYIASADKLSTSRILASTRIGIKAATNKKWRFSIKGNTFVSK